MRENKIGNRGSKSVYTVKTVKEQRVNGNYGILNPLSLRYTLMGFERNYPIQILSKQLNICKFSTFSDQNSNTNILNP